MIPIPSLTDIPERLAKIKAMLLAAWRPQSSVNQENDPDTLIRLLAEFVAMLDNLDQRYGKNAPIGDDDATRLGDTGLAVITELGQIGQQLGVPQAKMELDIISVAVADWMMRHNGRLDRLEPIVNGLAVMANEIQTAQTLEEIAAFMGQVMQSALDSIQADEDKSDEGRPWRVLQLNRAIVATRSHNTDLMGKVFDELIQGLPNDAPTFFREGMRQMEVIDYPAKVRAVMAHYFQGLTQHTLH